MFRIFFNFAFPQITTNGIINEPEYILIATKQNTNQGFGLNIDVQKIYYYSNVANSILYLGVICKLNTESPDGIGIWLNVTGPGSYSGRPAAQSLGISGRWSLYR